MAYSDALSATTYNALLVNVTASVPLNCAGACEIHWWVTLTIASLGLLANVFFVLLPHVKDPLDCFKSPSSWLVLHISMIDIISNINFIAVCIIAMTTTHTDAVLLLSNVAFALSSIVCPACFLLSLERFSSIAFPLRHRTRVTRRLCFAAISLVWLMHLLFVTLVVTLHPLVNSFGGGRHLIPHYSYTLPFFLLSQATSFATFVPLRRQRNAIIARQRGSRQQTSSVDRATMIRIENERRFMWTVTIICFVSGASLIPSVAYQLLHTNLDKRLMVMSATVTVHALSLINFAVNPFVYLWRLPKYRKTVKTLYCNKLCNQRG